MNEQLKTQYEEVCRSHQAITDFRMKLLSLLPVVSGAGFFLLERNPDQTGGDAEAVFPYLGLIGLFGVAVSAGLFLYELRGMHECLQLRYVGERLESALGVPWLLSRFRNTRPGMILGPQGAGWVIYSAVLAAWLYVACVGFSWPTVARLLLPGLLLAGLLGWWLFRVWRWQLATSAIRQVEKDINRRGLEALLERFDSIEDQKPAGATRVLASRSEVAEYFSGTFSREPDDFHAQLLRDFPSGHSYVDFWSDWTWSATTADGTRKQLLGVMRFQMRDGQISRVGLYVEPINEAARGIECQECQCRLKTDPSSPVEN